MTTRGDGPAAGSGGPPRLRCGLLFRAVSDARHREAIAVLLFAASALTQTAASAQACGIVWRPVVPTQAGFTFSALAASPGLAVAVGNGGATAVSRDGVTWEIPAIPPPEALDQLVYGNSRFLATNTFYQRMIYESADGVHWESRSLPLSQTLRCLTFANGWFIGTCLSGFLASRDGRDWVFRPNDGANSINAITYGAGRYVAVGYQGALLTSADGYTWTAGKLPSTATFKAIAYGGGRFVAVGVYDAPAIAVSTDGLTWVPANPPDVNWGGESIAYGNGRFLAQSWSQGFISSPDGMVWSHEESPDYGSGRVIWFLDKFIALGMDGILYSDSNGSTWTSLGGRLSAGQLMAVATGGTPPVAVAVGSSRFPARSVDGVHWTAVSTSLPDSSMNGMAYGGGRFVAVGAGDCTIASSADGTTWRAETPPNQTWLWDVAYGNGTFAAVGNNGVIFTSPDGSAWDWRDTGYREDLYTVTYGGGRFVAAGNNGTILATQDGRSWAAASSPLSEGYELRDVAYGAGRFVASISNGLGVLFSEDGLAWRQITLGTMHSQSLHYAMGRFIMWSDESDGKVIAFSEDGLSWESSPWRSPVGVTDMAPWGDGLIAVGWAENGLAAVLPGEGCLPFLSGAGPNSGPSSGGSPVVLTGSGLDRGISAIFFGNERAGNFSVDSPEQVTVISPSHPPGIVAVTTLLADGSSADAGAAVYEYVPANPVPDIRVIKMGGKPFKLKIQGVNFRPDCVVRVDGLPVPQTTYKSDKKILAEGGDSLEAMFPPGGQVAVTVENTGDRTTSEAVFITRP